MIQEFLSDPYCGVNQTSFLFMGEYYFMVWIDHILFIHSFIDEHLDSLPLYGAMGNPGYNIGLSKFSR